MSNRKSSLLNQSSIFKIENGIIKGEEYPFMDSEDNNFGERLLKKMKSDPDFIAQIEASTGKEDTFGEMADRSIRCALWMKSQGLKPGDVVAICTDNHLDSIIPCLASLFIGVVFNPWWDHGLTEVVARHFVNLTKPKILFTNEASAKIGIEVAKEENVDLKIVVFGCEIDGTESFRDVIKIPKTKEVENFQCTKFQSAKHPAFILYTSGTTGLPKGVLHSHESMFGNINLIAKIGENNCTSLWYSTLCWVTGIVCPFSTIYQGNKRIVANDFTGNQLCELVEKYKINWIIMGTSPATRLLTSGAIPNHDMSSVDYIWIGGAILKEMTQRALEKLLPTARILQAYGMTEFGGLTVRQTNNKNVKSIGTVAGNIQLKIIDPDSGKILGPNETGEACFKSPFMMTEYYNNPEKTKEAIDSDGWLHTGDLCYYDEDGLIFIIDRLKELIKWRGHHVSPAVVEQLIQTLPGVTEAAVVGVPDYEDDERPFAFVAKTSDATVTGEDIKKLVEDKLPEQMRLRAGVQFLDQIPHTASGKIARSELKKIAFAYARNN